MKNIISIISSIITIYVISAYTLMARPSSVTSKVSTESIQIDKRLTTLHELFTTLGIKLDPTYEAMNTYAQAHWLRKSGQERW